MRFRITVEGQDMGFTRLIDTDDPQREQRWPYGLDFSSNRSYHCPGCGALWAIWEREDSPLLEWYPSRRTCPQHALGAWTGDKPGSLILYPSDLIVLPRLALEREVLRENVSRIPTIDIDNLNFTVYESEVTPDA